MILRLVEGGHSTRFVKGTWVVSGKLLDWQTWMQAQAMSPATVKSRVRRVQVFGESLSVAPEDASAADVIGYLSQLTISRNSRAVYYAHLKAWFTWLVTADQHRDDNPCERVPSPKTSRRQPRPVTDRELDAILRVRVHKRTRMMLLLAAFQGLRVHEIAKIRGEDVNLKDNQLRVIGKGGVDVTLPLHPIIAGEAENYPRRGYWFPTHNGNERGQEGPILPRSVSNMLCNVFERAGVSGGAHRLRHWHGTKLVEEDVNIRIVQTLLRHASLSTTALYTKVSLDQQHDALSTLKRPPTAA